ncbi:MAG TPA: alpha/beta hydrolase-fold protein [Pyrinomonadaceae bacterium]|jgi:hypothetical protein
MRRIILYVLFLVIPAFCFGQATREAAIHSEVLNQDRKLWINVPQYYDLRQDSFQIVFVLDGNNRSLFEYAAASKRFLERNAVDLSEFNAPESIIVGIEQKERWTDFADNAGSDKFFRFLTDEVFPFVRKNYRTQNYTILIGHSLAGRFALDALLRRPDLFNAVIAASPAYGKKNIDEIKSKIDALAKSGLANDRALYVSTTYLKNDGTEQQFREFAEALNLQFKDASYRNFRFRFGSSETLGHAKSPYFSIPEGLHFIYAPSLWQIDVRSLFDKNSSAVLAADNYRQRIKERFGVSISMRRYAPILIDELVKANKTADAIRFLTGEVNQNPTDLDLFANLLTLLKKNKLADYNSYKARFIKTMKQINTPENEQAEWLKQIDKDG